MILRVLSVNVARPRIIGVADGVEVISSIDKKPVSGAHIFIGTTNIEGDGQADLGVHGGADKAVYVYPRDNWDWWEKEKQLSCRPGAFGENLTLEGADEEDVAIGDRFQWGEALLEVSQPRAPCYKFAIHARRADAPQIMTLSARCGWYLRVLREGLAPCDGEMTRMHRSDSPSVRESFMALLHPRQTNEVIERVAAAPALADVWRRGLKRRALGR